MAVSRTTTALICVCIGMLLMANVSARAEPAEKVEGAGATAQDFFDTVKVDATPLNEASADSFAAVDLQDYSPTANCRPKPCKH